MQYQARRKQATSRAWRTVPTICSRSTPPGRWDRWSDSTPCCSGESRYVVSITEVLTNAAAGVLRLTGQKSRMTSTQLREVRPPRYDGLPQDKPFHIELQRRSERSDATAKTQTDQ